MSREVVDAASVVSVGHVLRSASAAIPRGSAPGLPSRGGGLSLGSDAARFDDVWGDGLNTLRLELGLLAGRLEQAGWQRLSLEHSNAQLLAHAAEGRRGVA